MFAIGPDFPSSWKDGYDAYDGWQKPAKQKSLLGRLVLIWGVREQ